MTFARVLLERHAIEQSAEVPRPPNGQRKTQALRCASRRLWNAGSTANSSMAFFDGALLVESLDVAKQFRGSAQGFGDEELVEAVRTFPLHLAAALTMMTASLPRGDL
jgi:hypothetical protein